MNTARRHAYQHPHSTLTLREGLREYFESNPGLLDPDDPEQAQSAHAAELFHGHDTVHVVFGTNTDIRQEAMTDIWAMVGTDVGAWTYMGYLSTPEAVQILRDIGQGTAERTGWWALVRESVKAIPAMLSVWRRSRRMHRKWPWKDHERYLDVPLVDIRAEFGIEVFQPGVSESDSADVDGEARAAA